MSVDAAILARIERLEALVAERDRQLAERDRQLAEREALIAKLERRVAELEELLGANSSNSGKPPSSDTPAERAERRKAANQHRKRSGRKRGGQPGHKGHSRALVPLEEVDEVVRCRPEVCCGCGVTLPHEIEPVAVRREQIFELPPIVPLVTEYRQELVACGLCCVETWGTRPAGAPPGGYGPRLTAVVAMLTGVYHLGRRRAVELLRDGFGVRMSLGAVSGCEHRMSEALAVAHDEAREHVANAETRYVDATTWWSGSASASVWVLATSMVTFLAVTARSTRQALLGLIGRVAGRVVCDRATVFNCWHGSARQTCWAHLLRYFEAMLGRAGPSSRIGHDLCLLSGAMFHVWHQFKAGTIDRARLQAALGDSRHEPLPGARSAPTSLIEHVKALLEEGTRSDHPKTAGTCRDLLDKHWDSMWTFVDVDGVEPTNNHGERELRWAVLWRKRSFGTQSDRGDRFAERILTTARTLRKQERHLLTFLVQSLRAAWSGTAPPSLLPSDHVTP
jgi:transposase